MKQGAQTIDYHQYSTFMRKALSGPQISNEDGTLNHLYFNTKKGFYWSEQHNDMLRDGLIKYGIDWSKIRALTFNNTKSQIQIQLRACLLLGIKESSKINEQQLADLLKTPAGKILPKTYTNNSTSKKK